MLAPEQFSLTPQKRPRGRPRKQPASTVVAAAKEEQREELTVQVECLPELTQDGDSRLSWGGKKWSYFFFNLFLYF